MTIAAALNAADPKMHRHRRIVVIVSITIIYDVIAYMRAYVHLHIATPTMTCLTLHVMLLLTCVLMLPYRATLTMLLLTLRCASYTAADIAPARCVCLMRAHAAAEQCGCVPGTLWMGGWVRTRPSRIIAKLS